MPLLTVAGRPRIIDKKPRGNNYLRFAEKLNGRCAMQGVVWSAAEAMTGNHQFDTLYLIGVTGAVALGTAMTYSPDEELTYSVFTPETELLNGRAAMLGMAALAANQIAAAGLF
jgi:hypothetical protein